MKRYYAPFTIGKDRPGIVAEVAGLIEEPAIENSLKKGVE